MQSPSIIDSILKFPFRICLHTRPYLCLCHHFLSGIGWCMHWRELNETQNPHHGIIKCVMQTKNHVDCHLQKDEDWMPQKSPWIAFWDLALFAARLPTVCIFHFYWESGAVTRDSSKSTRLRIQLHWTEAFEGFKVLKICITAVIQDVNIKPQSGYGVEFKWPPEHVFESISTKIPHN